MFFEQFKVEGLGCLSYLIGCPQSGVASVVDPERHVDRYIEAARANGLRISHVFDTHLHADHISGAAELGYRTGAPACIHRAADARYPHTALSDGDHFEFGSVAVDVLETPGHTPDSITLALTDRSRSEAVMLLLTGDLLFVGDVGRPDLAGHDRLDEQVRNLYDSLHTQLSRFPEWTEIYPAHGEGSSCGKHVSAKPMGTLGFERHHDPLLEDMPFEQFHQAMTGNFQVRPTNFMAIVGKNRRGPAFVAHLPPMRTVAPEEVEIERNREAQLVDIRSQIAFGSAFINGSINVGLSPTSVNWLGMVVDGGRDIVLVSETPESAHDALMQFRRVGYDHIIGALDDGLASWVRMGKPLDHLPQVTPELLRGVLDRYAEHVVLDVRTANEFAEGHLERAVNRPLSELVLEVPDLPKDRHLTTVCQSGYRSNIAGSYLKSQGFTHVFSLIGGMTAWENSLQT